MTARDPFDFGGQRGSFGGPPGFGNDGGPVRAPGSQSSQQPPPPKRQYSWSSPVRSSGTGLSMALAVLAALAGAALAATALLDPATAASVPLAFTGWLVAGPVAIGLLAVHSVRRVSAQSAALVSVRSVRTTALYWVVLLVAAGGIGLGAWRIADWVARW